MSTIPHTIQHFDDSLKYLKNTYPQVFELWPEKMFKYGIVVYCYSQQEAANHPANKDGGLTKGRGFNDREQSAFESIVENGYPNTVRDTKRINRYMIKKLKLKQEEVVELTRLECCELIEEYIDTIENGNEYVRPRRATKKKQLV